MTKLSLNTQLIEELQRMITKDYEVREDLAKDGSLFEGYHPVMEDVHNKNGARLLEIIEEFGWPGKTLVGIEGEKNAWLIAQHAISMPSLQRKVLNLLKEGSAKNEISLDQIAMLEDRIRIYEGRKQIYGTQFDWDANDELAPLHIEDSSNVNYLRAKMNLLPIEEVTKKHRENAKNNNEEPPKDKLGKQRSFEEWVVRVGWQKK